MKALRFEPLIEQRRQLLQDGQRLVVALKEERHAERVERVVDLARGREIISRLAWS